VGIKLGDLKRSKFNLMLDWLFQLYLSNNSDDISDLKILFRKDFKSFDKDKLDVLFKDWSKEFNHPESSQFKKDFFKEFF